MVAKERGYNDGMLPFVQLGRYIDRRFNGGIAGFLGDEFNPFEVADDPNAARFQVRDLEHRRRRGRTRLDRRYAMLTDLENYQNAVEGSPVRARDAFYEKAHGIITSPPAKKAFDIAAESERIRDRYGRTQFGQNCLLARRLIEAGVQFVTVTDGGWDTHTNNFKSLKERLLPRVDPGFSALIEDLKVRGMLENTLVVWFGDFGRTPKVNPSAGRDHWATAGVALHGRRRRSSRARWSAEPTRWPSSSPIARLAPQDLAATIYHCLGVPLHTWYKAQDGRPIELCPEGKPVRQLVG